LEETERKLREAENKIQEYESIISELRRENEELRNKTTNDSNGSLISSDPTSSTNFDDNSGGPPPPPPGPPPPPMSNSMSSLPSRGGLLSDIQKGKKLKKTPKETPSSTSSTSSSSTTSTNPKALSKTTSMPINISELAAQKRKEMLSKESPHLEKLLQNRPSKTELQEKNILTDRNTLRKTETKTVLAEKLQSRPAPSELEQRMKGQQEKIIFNSKKGKEEPKKEGAKPEPKKWV